ncbi:MAG: hypothetical protein HYY68_05850, partial [Thaumarchaeota archaeon]|nr:hypothetical protein [Nitrososphaerota archaeon]
MSPEQTKLNALCCSSSGRVGIMPVSALVKHKYDGEIYEISVPGGYTVKTTGNHSIEVFDQKTFTFEAKAVREVLEGDLVASCFGIPNNQGVKEVNLPELIASECPGLMDHIFVEGREATKFVAKLKKKYSKKTLREQFY